MRFEKKHLLDMNRCYAVAVMPVSGGKKVFFATEGEGPCVAFEPPEYAFPLLVSEGPGGCMGMVPVAGRPGDFLAGQRFFRMYQWEEAGLAWMEALPDGRWRRHDLMTLPYLHRFDILRGRDGAPWFIGCTLSERKESKEDWSVPGKVHVSPLPGSPEQWAGAFSPSALCDGLHQNHGYCRCELDGVECGLIGAKEGVFAAFPPASAQAAWRVEKILNVPAGDIAVADIDGDGILEMAVVENIHGNTFSIYKLGGAPYKMYEEPEHSDFYHVAWGGSLAGRTAFLAGNRRGGQSLFAIIYAGGKFTRLDIDSGVGPSNIAVFNDGVSDVIVSANREKAEGAIYRVFPD